MLKRQGEVGYHQNDQITFCYKNTLEPLSMPNSTLSYYDAHNAWIHEPAGTIDLSKNALSLI